MSTLTEQLKKEHSVIQDLLHDAKEQGITSDEGQSKFKKAKDLLLQHLKKEDDELYPLLTKNGASKAIADTFSEEMKAISKVANDFFTKYENAQSGLEFAQDFEAFLSALSSRIRKEENVLYSEYDKVSTH